MILDFAAGSARAGKNTNPCTMFLARFDKTSNPSRKNWSYGRRVRSLLHGGARQPKELCVFAENNDKNYSSGPRADSIKAACRRVRDNPRFPQKVRTLM